MEPDTTDLRAAVKAAGEWLKIDGVEGVAAGKVDDGFGILVNVSKPPESFKGTIPETFQTFPVQLKYRGKTKAQ